MKKETKEKLEKIVDKILECNKVKDEDKEKREEYKKFYTEELTELSVGSKFPFEDKMRYPIFMYGNESKIFHWFHYPRVLKKSPDYHGKEEEAGGILFCFFDKPLDYDSRKFDFGLMELDASDMGTVGFRYYPPCFLLSEFPKNGEYNPFYYHIKEYSYGKRPDGAPKEWERGSLSQYGGWLEKHCKAPLLSPACFKEIYDMHCKCAEKRAKNNAHSPSVGRFWYFLDFFNEEIDVAEEYQDKSWEDDSDANLVKRINLLLNRFSKEKVVPSIAILGDAGVGKTKLAKSLAKKFGNHEILSKTGADLKGAYIGQTSAAVYDLIKEAMGKGDDKQRKIIFIDEAYELMNDEFGREAVSILLPILSGDKNEVSCTKDIKNGDKENKRPTIEWKKKEDRPVIWLGGYEKELRLMLQHNMGLYRRLEKLTLKTPSVKRLGEVFWEKLEKDSEKNFEKENYDEKVKSFLAWATSPEHSRFFANYAGIEKLANYVLDGLELQKDEDNQENEDIQGSVLLSKAIDNAISLMKEEIERQYANQFKVSEKEREKLGVTVDEFQIIHDVPETNVIGYEKVTKEMDHILDMILNKENYQKLGITIPKGVLFVGPPGTGKSHMAKYMAYNLQSKKHYNTNEYTDDLDHKVGFISVVAVELNTPEKVKKLFLEAGEFDDCVIFIDEIDAIAKERGGNIYAPSMYRLMTEMDGFDSNTGIIVIAATNDPEALDPAMRRPGRFDREIEISYPDMDDRKRLLKEFIGRLDIIEGDGPGNIEYDDMIDGLARRMAYKTAAEIKALVNLAAISLSSNSKDKVSYKVSYKVLGDRIREEIDKRDIGEKKEEKTEGEDKGEKVPKTEKNEGAYSTAIHEVGHALISLKEYDKEPFAEITVEPRGNALGYVRRDPDEKKQPTRESLLKSIRISLGGRVAEEIFYGEDISAGAAQDIKEAYNNAWKMVFLFGMSEKIGFIPLAEYENSFLGDNIKYICSEAKRTEGEEEIKRIIDHELTVVRNYLRERKTLVEHLAREVFGKKTMTGGEFKEKYEELKKEESNCAN